MSCLLCWPWSQMWWIKGIGFKWMNYISLWLSFQTCSELIYRVMLRQSFPISLCFPTSVGPNTPCPKEEKNVFSITQTWVVWGMSGWSYSYDILFSPRQVILLQKIWRKNPVNFFSIPWAVWGFQTLLEHTGGAGLLKKSCVCGDVTKVRKLILHSNVNLWNIFHSKRYHILYMSGS